MPAGGGYRIAVLASGRGSNLHALIQAIDDGLLPAQIVGVFSNRPACPALQLARDHAIDTWAASPAGFDSREAFDTALFDQIEAVQPDLIVCAGYMRLISDKAVLRFPNRMINIHPSLLPLYPGLDTHARALAAGDTVHGASVHVVIPELDAGPVLAQARLPMEPGESAEALARRVLQREHPLLVRTVAALAAGKLAASPTGLRWNGTPLASPLSLSDQDRLEETPC